MSENDPTKPLCDLIKERRDAFEKKMLEKTERRARRRARRARRRARKVKKVKNVNVDSNVQNNTMWGLSFNPCGLFPGSLEIKFQYQPYTSSPLNDGNSQSARAKEATKANNSNPVMDESLPRADLMLMNSHKYSEKATLDSKHASIMKSTELDEKAINCMHLTTTYTPKQHATPMQGKKSDDEKSTPGLGNTRNENDLLFSSVEIKQSLEKPTSKCYNGEDMLEGLACQLQEPTILKTASRRSSVEQGNNKYLSSPETNPIILPNKSSMNTTSIRTDKVNRMSINDQGEKKTGQEQHGKGSVSHFSLSTTGQTPSDMTASTRTSSFGFGIGMGRGEKRMNENDRDMSFSAQSKKSNEDNTDNNFLRIQVASRKKRPTRKISPQSEGGRSENSKVGRGTFSRLIGLSPFSSVISKQASKQSNNRNTFKFTRNAQKKGEKKRDFTHGPDFEAKSLISKKRLNRSGSDRSSKGPRKCPKVCSEQRRTARKDKIAEHFGGVKEKNLEQNQRQVQKAKRKRPDEKKQQDSTSKEKQQDSTPIDSEATKEEFEADSPGLGRQANKSANRLYEDLLYISSDSEGGVEVCSTSTGDFFINNYIYDGGDAGISAKMSDLTSDLGEKIPVEEQFYISIKKKRPKKKKLQDPFEKSADLGPHSLSAFFSNLALTGSSMQHNYLSERDLRGKQH